MRLPPKQEEMSFSTRFPAPSFIQRTSTVNASLINRRVATPDKSIG
jgi:hypothetical protein